MMSEVKFLSCNNCGKQVSTGFYPVPTDTPDKGLIVRAWIECPECIEKTRVAPAKRLEKTLRQALAKAST